MLLQASSCVGPSLLDACATVITKGLGTLFRSTCTVFQCPCQRTSTVSLQFLNLNLNLYLYLSLCSMSMFVVHAHAHVPALMFPCGAMKPAQGQTKSTTHCHMAVPLQSDSQCVLPIFTCITSLWRHDSAYMYSNLGHDVRGSPGNIQAHSVHMAAPGTRLQTLPFLPARWRRRWRCAPTHPSQTSWRANCQSVVSVVASSLRQTVDILMLALTLVVMPPPTLP